MTTEVKQTDEDIAQVRDQLLTRFNAEMLDHAQLTTNNEIIAFMQHRDQLAIKRAQQELQEPATPQAKRARNDHDMEHLLQAATGLFEDIRYNLEKLAAGAPEDLDKLCLKASPVLLLAKRAVNYEKDNHIGETRKGELGLMLEAATRALGVTTELRLLKQAMREHAIKKEFGL